MPQEVKILIDDRYLEQIIDILEGKEVSEDTKGMIIKISRLKIQMCRNRQRNLASGVKHDMRFIIDF